MKDLKSELEEKKARLQKRIKARSEATCSSVISSEKDVQRELEIEELEEEISLLEKRMTETSQ